MEGVVLIKKIEIDPATKKALQELLSKQFLTDDEVAQLRRIANEIASEPASSPYRSVPSSSGESRGVAPSRSSG